jgi:GH24 family phage-related lysozyme (muramidase)
VRVTQWEYDALVSLAFNEGAAAIAGSTLVRQLNSGVKAPDVALHFLDWIYVTEHGVKRISKGHVVRRGREMLRFLGHMEPH